MRVAFFTAGTHGAGHLVRGLALKRALARAGFRGSYRMFGPRPPFPAITPADWETIEIVEQQLGTPDLARATPLARSLMAFSPDVLVVDMFWAPLRWILPLPSCEAWLLLRSFPATWLVGPPGFPFEASLFSRIVAIEPVGHERITHTIDPIVIANPDERRPRGSLRARLGVPDGRRLVAVAHAGLPGESDRLAPPRRPDDVVVTFDLFERDAIFPIAEWLDDCDAIHGAAGYNTFWEARWLGWSDRTTFTPIRRRNDDQPWRVAECRDYPMHANGADTLASWL